MSDVFTPTQFRARRKRLRLTLRELGAKIGYSHSTLWHYETGTRKITKRVTLLLRQLCEASS